MSEGPIVDSSAVRTLIVDDEALARALLRALVERDQELVLIGEATTGTGALKAIRNSQPDLVLLDVQMPLMDGMTLADRLQDMDDRPYLILVTAYDEFAVQAFDLGVLDYLVKPVVKERFQQAIQKAKDAIRQRRLMQVTDQLMALGRPQLEPPPTEEIIIRQGDRLISLDTDDIIWLEASNQYTTIHTSKGRFVEAVSLSQFGRRLDKRRFLRIHRSTIVNQHYVVEVLRRPNGCHGVVLRGGHELAVARSRKSLLPELLRSARQCRQAG